MVAATGNDRHLDQAHTIASGDVASDTVQTGIDSAGDALVIWSDWVNNEPHGVFAAVNRP